MNNPDLDCAPTSQTFPPSADLAIGYLLTEAGEIRIVGQPGTGKTELIAGVLERMAEHDDRLRVVRPTRVDSVRSIQAQVARAQAQGHRFVLILDGVAYPHPRVDGELRVTTALVPEPLSTPQVLLGGDRLYRVFPHYALDRYLPLTEAEGEEPGFETLRNVLFRSGYPVAETYPGVYEVALPRTVVALYGPDDEADDDDRVPLAEAGWVAAEPTRPLYLPGTHPLASGVGPESLLEYLETLS